jgi:hypothetical protein
VLVALADTAEPAMSAVAAATVTAMLRIFDT